VLAEELKKYIDVDIYGKCGNLSCGAGNCFDHTKIYRFYFSFENSLCDDYITEKVYRTMQHIIIPVVYNGVEMSRFLPPHSYIDANAFATPEELAKHLIFLSNNPEEYVKYFWWREHYHVIDYYHLDLWNICKKVSERKWEFETQVYGNINNWFNGCTKPKIKFE
jgi:alpha-1,3-fucosyltransferase